MPTTWSSGPTRKTVLLETVLRSIGAENGIEMRGWMLKPSSVSSTSMSAQSEEFFVQSGFGRSTRRPVSCDASGVVSRLVGNGCPAETPASALPGNASARATSVARMTDRIGSPFLSPEYGTCRTLSRYAEAGQTDAVELSYSHSI